MSAAVMSPPGEVGEMKMEIEQQNDKPALTPPTSENTDKKEDDSDSELSDLEPEEPESATEPKGEPVEEEEIVPDHYYEDGKVPVFKPTLAQFRSFPEFIKRIDKYGMKSGIVKVVPPKEWRNSLPTLDEQVKTIKVKNPITQEFHGTHGTYTQANIEKQRSYNLPQWKDLSEESSHQPPAKRGERRRNQEKPTRAPSTRTRNTTGTGGSSTRKGPGRPRVRPLPGTIQDHEEGTEEGTEGSRAQTPLTPISPPLKPVKLKKEQPSGDEAPKPKGRQPKSDQAKSVSSRRQHNRRDQAEIVDEEAFKNFDYRVHNQDEWTTERVQELEIAYWKSLNFSNPMYGADMPGSLFDDTTKEWNVAKLENLLDVLGQNVPGVNTAYLYLGMWKASFAWHLEDVDLYSINYIHFGAPKQWYSISQEDARRFEAAMRTIWPNDAKNCDQFLRHKTYLISPSLLQSQFNIRVNRLVHHEGEFVITFPYGYHSGYNLGYNCAESVNFATDAWLEYGKVARKCNCEADSVWVDVREIERKLRGEPTPEYYEETDDEEDDEEEDEPSNLPTPPGSVKGRPKRSHKRKRDPNEKDSKPKVKKLRIKLKAPAYEPCILCPNDSKYEELLSTDNGQQAHRRCAIYTPETYIVKANGVETIVNIAGIDKARLELKCNYCRNKKGSVFQCSQKKCTRAYHATCAAQAGVLVDRGVIPVYGEDGTEYTDIGNDFRCRIHRGRRGKYVDGAALEEISLIRKTALKLPIGEVVQMQYLQGEIFAGVVLENRKSEETLLIEVLPKGDKVEVEYKWLLVFDPVNSQRPIPSENAKPWPAELARMSRTTGQDPAINEGPKPKDLFCDSTLFRWEEFDTCKAFHNPQQVKVDLSMPRKLWFYLGKYSTEAKAQYTGDLAVRKNDASANFLETVRIASITAAPPPVPRRSYPASHPFNQNAINAAGANHVTQQPKALTNAFTYSSPTKERPYHGKYAINDRDRVLMDYQYKPRVPPVNVDPLALKNQHQFQHEASMPAYQSRYQNMQGTSHLYQNYRAPQAQMRPLAPTANMVYGKPPMLQHYQGTPEYKVSGLGFGESSSKLIDFPQRPQSSHQQSQTQFQQHQYYGYQQQQIPKPEAYQRSQAPVANMMASSRQLSHSSTTSQNPFSRSSSAELPRKMDCLPQAMTETPKPEIKQVSYLKVKSTYAYLHDAEKLRPRVYQSPYAPEGGFTDAYLPAPVVAPKMRPRGPSISEDYLMKRSSSQQEQVNLQLTHDRAKAQEEAQALAREQAQHQADDTRSESQSHAHSRSNSLQQHCHHPQPQHPQHLPMSAIQQPQSTYRTHSPPHYHNPHASANSFQHYNHYSPSYASSALLHHTAPAYQYQSLQNYQQPANSAYRSPSPAYSSHYSNNQSLATPGGLQFQSPQDFQMQMQREAQQSQHDGFDNFFKGMQSAAHTQNEHSGGQSWGSYSSGGSGGQGSPLKYEMNGSGGEMLPQMREGGRF